MEVGSAVPQASSEACRLSGGSVVSIGVVVGGETLGVASSALLVRTFKGAGLRTVVSSVGSGREAWLTLSQVTIALVPEGVLLISVRFWRVTISGETMLDNSVVAAAPLAWRKRITTASVAR